MHHLSDHPNVISIKGAYEDAVAVHVVMELCAGGELFDRIIQKGHFTERRAAELARVIVGVVQACHSLGVMHRDLKPENFMFVNQSEEALLKTIDFGLSTFFRPGELYTDVVGGRYYVAPEVLRKRYCPEADIWSVGVIIYILLSGVPPFWAETEEGIFDEILHGVIDFEYNPWPSISDSAKDLVKRMLIINPKKKLTAHEVLLKIVNQKCIMRRQYLHFYFQPLQSPADDEPHKLLFFENLLFRTLLNGHPWVQVDGVAPDHSLDSAVLTRLKQFSAMNKLKKMALRADVDNSGTIDYGEFIAATLHLNKIEQEDHLFAAFSYFDKDGSGYISRDELQHACEEFGLQNIRWEDIIQDGRIDYNEFVVLMQMGNGFYK